MAASTPLLSAPLSSQKQRRAAQRKERRKRKRRALAQARESGLKTGAGDAHGEEEEEEEEEEVINDEHDEEEEEVDPAEEERLRLHAQWLERERLAQEEFRLKVEKEEAAQRRKEEEERMIKEEWEAQQKKEREEKEQKQQEKRDREEAVQKMLDEAENQLQLDNGGGAWMNPEAPLTDKSENYGTECDVNNCPFFLKTGACRFGDRCSRKHFYPTSSPTLMIRGMFRTFGMEEARRDDYDIDACLEHSEEELHESFVEFYHDVLPEFRSVGKVVQFKISCNYEPHLRGNVYIQFDTEEQCKEAFIKFNGRWYAGRQLHCEMCPVTRWKNAICGLFDRQKCPKGKHCNFLHVFRNPGNEFWEADRDWHLSPNCGVRGSRRDGWYSERYRERSWRSGSPPRSERTHNRRRSRSRSRERRDKEDKWTPGWRRHGDRRKDVSRGRDRSRSRSRDRDRDRENNKYRRRSEERDGRDKDGETRGRSRSTSAERRRKRRSNRDSKERSKKTQSDDGNAHRRHKHSSKKNKKKSKKKHKKKRHVTEGTTSSDESEKEEEKTEEEETENCSAATETILKTSDVDQSVDSETKSSSPQGQSERSNTETPTGRMDAPT